MKKNIYGGKSQEVEKRFSQICDARKILVVPIDFAKKEHTVQFCFGNGEFLFKNPLKVWNNQEGVRYLEKKLQNAMSRYSISRFGVIFGGEDPPSWALNFVNSLRSSGYLFEGVKATDAKRFRTNTRASNDVLDLNGIAQSLINRRGAELRNLDDIYTGIRAVSRNRQRLVEFETALKNRIHKSVDVLFPGFLDEKLSGISPFSSSCLWFLEKGFSLWKIKKMRDRTILEALRSNRQKNPEKTLEMLRALAEKALPPMSEFAVREAENLSINVALMQKVTECIFKEETKMAQMLVQTPGVYLTSMPGIGIVLAGGIVGEPLPGMWSRPDKIASYAGIVPRLKQTGGKEPVSGTLPEDANRMLKNFLLQAALHVGTTPHPAGKYIPEFAEHRLMRYYAKTENRNGKGRLATAKAFLMTASTMMRTKSIYVPNEWLKGESKFTEEEFILYHEIVLETMKKKWRQYDLSGIPETENNLVILEKQINELKKRNNKNQACLL